MRPTRSGRSWFGRQLGECGEAVDVYLGCSFFRSFLCKRSFWKWWTLPAGREPALDLKAGYLNHGFFYFRVVAYFVVLGIFSYSFWKRSTSQDKDGAASAYR